MYLVHKLSKNLVTIKRDYGNIVTCFIRNSKGFKIRLKENSAKTNKPMYKIMICKKENLSVYTAYN